MSVKARLRKNRKDFVCYGNKRYADFYNRNRISQGQFGLAKLVFAWLENIITYMTSLGLDCYKMQLSKFGITIV